MNLLVIRFGCRGPVFVMSNYKMTQMNMKKKIKDLFAR